MRNNVFIMILFIMNPDFLKKQMEKQMMSSQDHPKGI